MAISWSYAAALHLGIDPAIVLHDDGYKGGGASLLDGFREGRYLAVHMLQWVGMTIEKSRAAADGGTPYPHMLRWLCEADWQD